MGPESKIEFTGGTLYFAPLNEHGGVVGTFDQINEVCISEEVAAIPLEAYRIISKNKSVEFEGTCEIKFRGLVKLLGFWPAVKYKADRLAIRIKKYLRIVSPSGRY